jgi:hypothetical protein
MKLYEIRKAWGRNALGHRCRVYRIVERVRNVWLATSYPDFYTRTDAEAHLDSIRAGIHW